MFDHSMNATITFRPKLEANVAFAALQPLMDYFDWTVNEIVNQKPLAGEDFVHINTEGPLITSMEIYTCGDESGAYRNVLEKVAANIGSLAEPGFFELKDHDTPDVANAIERFWFGDPAMVRAEKVSMALRSAAEALIHADVPKETIQFIEQILRNDDASEHVKSIEQAKRATEATLFFNELENDVGALVEIGKKYGDDTIRDLFYLHSAILSGSYVEHFRNDSLLLEVVDQLTSADKWKKSIESIK